MVCTIWAIVNCLKIICQILHVTGTSLDKNVNQTFNFYSKFCNIDHYKKTITSRLTLKWPCKFSVKLTVYPKSNTLNKMSEKHLRRTCKIQDIILVHFKNTKTTNTYIAELTLCKFCVWIMVITNSNSLPFYNLSYKFLVL